MFRAHKAKNKNRTFLTEKSFSFDKNWTHLKLDLHNKGFQIAFLALLALFAFIVNLGLFEPDIMEARNFIAAREMLDNGKFLLPTMNGLPRLEKPPFPTWFSAFFLNFFGESEFWLRLPAALMAVLLVTFTYKLSKLLFKSDDSAFASAIVLMTIPMVIIMGRTGSWDIFCISTTLVGVYYLFRLMRDQDQNTGKNTLLAALFIGFSSMSKGPVGFFAMLIPFIIAYMLAFGLKDFKRVTRQLLTFAILALLIAGWWYMYARLQAPEASTAIAEKEVEAWANRHTQPFYFYFPFPFFTGIWALVVIYAFFFKRLKKNQALSREYVFLFFWLISSVVLLSLVPEKKERYLLPAYPPLAILTGRLFIHLVERIKNSAEKQKIEKGFLNTFNYLLVFALFIAPIAALIVFQKQMFMSLRAWVIFAALNAPIAFFAFRNLQKRLYFRQLYALGLFLILVIVSIYPVLPKAVYQNSEFKDIREVREENWYSEQTFYSNYEINPKAIWRIGKPVKEVKLPEEITESEFIFFTEDAPSILRNKGFNKEFNIDSLSSYHYFRKKSNYRLYVYKMRH